MYIVLALFPGSSPALVAYCTKKGGMIQKLGREVSAAPISHSFYSSPPPYSSLPSFSLFFLFFSTTLSFPSSHLIIISLPSFFPPSSFPPSLFSPLPPLFILLLLLLSLFPLPFLPPVLLPQISSAHSRESLYGTSPGSVWPHGTCRLQNK